MARRIDVREKRSNPANPTFFGEDVETVAWQALGLGATAYGNDKLATPVLKNFIPVSGGAMGKAVDALSTGITAWLLGEGVGMADKRVGKFMKHGGMILAAGRALSILIPGFSISATQPTFLPNGVPPKALPAAGANGGTASLVRVGRLGI